MSSSGLTSSCLIRGRTRWCTVTGPASSVRATSTSTRGFTPSRLSPRAVATRSRRTSSRSAPRSRTWLRGTGCMSRAQGPAREPRIRRPSRLTHRQRHPEGRRTGHRVHPQTRGRQPQQRPRLVRQAPRETLRQLRHRRGRPPLRQRTHQGRGRHSHHQGIRPKHDKHPWSRHVTQKNAYSK